MHLTHCFQIFFPCFIRISFVEPLGDLSIAAAANKILGGQRKDAAAGNLQRTCEFVHLREQLLIQGNCCFYDRRKMPLSSSVTIGRKNVNTIYDFHSEAFNALCLSASRFAASL